jgi:hypothetical protein
MFVPSKEHLDWLCAQDFEDVCGKWWEFWKWLSRDCQNFKHFCRGDWQDRPEPLPGVPTEGGEHEKVYVDLATQFRAGADILNPPSEIKGKQE